MAVTLRRAAASGGLGQILALGLVLALVLPVPAVAQGAPEDLAEEARRLVALLERDGVERAQQEFARTWEQLVEPARGGLAAGSAGEHDFLVALAAAARERGRLDAFRVALVRPLTPVLCERRASWAEQQGRLDEARDHVERGLSLPGEAFRGTPALRGILRERKIALLHRSFREEEALADAEAARPVGATWRTWLAQRQEGRRASRARQGRALALGALLLCGIALAGARWGAPRVRSGG